MTITRRDQLKRVYARLTADELAHVTATSAGRNLPAVYEYACKTVAPGQTVLDYGSGKNADHTQELRRRGHDVTPHEVGDNVTPSLHDEDALSKSYDVVLASDVLHTLPTVNAVKAVVEDLHKSVKPSGRVIVNYRERGRSLNDPTANRPVTAVKLKSLLTRYFTSVHRVGGTVVAPVWELHGPVDKKPRRVDLSRREVVRKYSLHPVSDLTGFLSAHLDHVIEEGFPSPPAGMLADFLEDRGDPRHELVRGHEHAIGPEVTHPVNGRRVANPDLSDGSNLDVTHYPGDRHPYRVTWYSGNIGSTAGSRFPRFTYFSKRFGTADEVVSHLSQYRDEPAVLDVAREIGGHALRRMSRRRYGRVASRADVESFTHHPEFVTNAGNRLAFADFLDDNYDPRGHIVREDERGASDYDYLRPAHSKGSHLPDGQYVVATRLVPHDFHDLTKNYPEDMAAGYRVTADFSTPDSPYGGGYTFRAHFPDHDSLLAHLDQYPDEVRDKLRRVVPEPHVRDYDARKVQYSRKKKRRRVAEAIRTFSTPQPGGGIAPSGGGCSVAMSRRSRLRELVRRYLRGDHKYGCALFDLPDAVGKKVLELGKSIPDDDLSDEGREPNPHVTLFYGLHDDSPDGVEEVVKGFGPVKMTLGKTAVFEKDDGDVVYVSVASDDLAELNGKVREGTENTTKYPEYVPHVTLAYVKKGRGKEYAGLDALDGVEVELTDLTFSPASGEKSSIKLSRPSNRLRNLLTARRKYAAVDHARSFVDALRELRSENQQVRHKVASDVFARVGLRGQWTDALHDTAGTTLPSLVSRLDSSPDGRELYAAAWYGLLTELPGVAVFRHDDAGPDSVYAISTKESPERVRDLLDHAGIRQRVLVPHAKGTTVFHVDLGSKNQDAFAAFAHAVGSPTVYAGRGVGKVVGGRDMTTARDRYRSVIGEYEQPTTPTEPMKRSRKSRLVERLRRGGVVVKKSLVSSAELLPFLRDHTASQTGDRSLPLNHSTPASLVLADFLDDRTDPRGELVRESDEHLRRFNQFARGVAYEESTWPKHVAGASVPAPTPDDLPLMEASVWERPKDRRRMYVIHATIGAHDEDGRYHAVTGTKTFDSPDEYLEHVSRYPEHERSALSRLVRPSGEPG
jgi:2'-5' RNA ligase